MKVYIVETVEDLGSPGYDINLVNISSTFENAILFLKKAIEDSNSGIEINDEIQITEETLDEYFGDVKVVDRLPVQAWIDNYENKLSEERAIRESENKELRKIIEKFNLEEQEN